MRAVFRLFLSSAIAALVLTLFFAQPVYAQNTTTNVTVNILQAGATDSIVVFTGNITPPLPVITGIPDTSSLRLGMVVTGPGLAGGTSTIAPSVYYGIPVSPGEISLSANTVGAVTAGTFTATPHGMGMPYGTVCTYIIGAQGGAMSVTESGWGVVPAHTQFCGTIVNGTIAGGINVPDSLHSNLAAPFNYNFVIQQTDASGDPIGLPIQINNVAGVTGTTWALDQYAPPVTVPTPTPIVGYNATVPTSCTSPSIWTTPGGGFYSCVMGVYSGIGSAASGITQLIGDINTASGAGVQPATLATVNSTPGTCGDATHVCQTTTNAKGLTTAQSAVAITASGSGPSYVGQVQNLASLVPTGNAQNSLQVIANSVAGANRFQFTDGTFGYYASTTSYPDMWIDDFTQSVMTNPSEFPTADIQNAVSKFLATANGNGQTALSITPTTATVASYTSGNAPSAIYLAADTWAMLPQLCYVQYQRSGSTSCYSSIVATYKSGSTYNPRSGSTHMMEVISNSNEYVCSYAFMEVPRNTGDVANCNVWLAAADTVMQIMATAAGDSTNAMYFGTELAEIKTGLAGEMTDSTTKLLIAATGQNSANLDIESTALACGFNAFVPGANLLPLSQCQAISNYFHTNLSSLTYNGFVIISPTSWAYKGVTTGSSSYTAQPTGYSTNQYQDHAYWSVMSYEFAYTLALEHLGDIPAFVASARDSLTGGIGNPAIEWINYDGSTTNASVENQESPQGFAAIASNLALPTPVTAGAGCVNYGALVNGSCGGSGLSNPFNVSATQVVNGGTSANVPWKFTTSSPTNTAMPVCNTTANTCFNELVNGSASGAYAGLYCGLITDADGSAGVAPFCLDRNNLWYALGASYSFRWYSGPAGGSSTDTGFSHPSAGHISIDGATPGDGLGTLICANCGSGFTYGTPTVTSGANAGASLVASQWPLSDHAFTVVATPTATISASTVFATINFGKTWKTAATGGSGEYANCVAAAALPPAAGVAIYVIAPDATGQHVTIGTGVAQTLTSGTTYAWVVQCVGDYEQ